MVVQTVMAPEDDLLRRRLARVHRVWLALAAQGRCVDKEPADVTIRDLQEAADAGQPVWQVM